MSHKSSGSGTGWFIPARFLVHHGSARLPHTPGARRASLAPSTLLARVYRPSSPPVPGLCALLHPAKGWYTGHRSLWSCGMNFPSLTLHQEPPLSSLKRDNHAWGAPKADPGLWEHLQGQERLQSVPAKSQQLLKCLPRAPPGLCRLPVPARDSCKGREGTCLEKDGIGATSLENHLGIQVLSSFKGAKFPFTFPSTFLLQARGVWRVCASFRPQPPCDDPPAFPAHGTLLNKFSMGIFGCFIHEHGQIYPELLFQITQGRLW